MKAIHIRDDQAMRRFGADLASAVPQNCVIYLVGELGAGKTTLARGFLRGLGYSKSVKSPTYTLVEQYVTAQRTVYHLDLYRLADPEELEFLGLRDWLQNDAVLLIEWPQLGKGVVPLADVEVCIDYAETARQVRLQPNTELGTRIVSTF